MGHGDTVLATADGKALAAPALNIAAFKIFPVIDRR